jgi:triosephosphate isomerase (TIM)
MLADAGCRYVILGHSERRADQGESDADVRAKAEAAIKAGLSVVLCVGETEAQRDSGAALALVGRQLAASLPEGAQAAHLAVAYEPVWAIGTGRTPTEADIAAMHRELRGLLSAKLGAGEASHTRILYGGSVKPSNAAQIMALSDVDGALVGGASLVAADFMAIAAACR